MSPFSDPKMERRKDQYFKRNRDPQFLYQGPQEAIVKELKAWVVRRKEVAREQIALKDKLQDSTRELIRYGPILNGPIEPRELEARNTKAMDILRRDADTDSRFTVRTEIKPRPPKNRVLISTCNRSSKTRTARTPRERNICSTPSDRVASPGQSSGGDPRTTAASAPSWALWTTRSTPAPRSPPWKPERTRTGCRPAA